jgi:hypothetical protein
MDRKFIEETMRSEFLLEYEKRKEREINLAWMNFCYSPSIPAKQFGIHSLKLSGVKFVKPPKYTGTFKFDKSAIK